MKKSFIILGFLIVSLIVGLSADANQLHTITLEKNNNSYNIILDSDSNSKVTKKVVSNDEIILELSGITASDTINALYKGTNSIDNLVIENSGFNKLKIYITAPNVNTSSIIMSPADGSQNLVGDGVPLQKVIWSIFVLAIFAGIIKRSISKTKEENSLLIKRDIKDREIALYRQYRKSIDEDVSLLTNKNARMKNMLNKIDRKIDERIFLSSK